jgi:hypothetical protein
MARRFTPSRLKNLVLLDRTEAERFLALLDPGATAFTFQTFDDNADRNDRKLARILQGSLADRWATLADLNARGAGIFVTINETDLKGRTTENVVRVRALFVDIDGAPLDPVMKNGLAPHVVVASSPERWHVYWNVADVNLDKFRSKQKALIERFNSDANVHDLPRVMRLPGFLHRKRTPYLVHIASTHEAAPYPGTDFAEASNDRPPSRGERPRLTAMPEWLMELMRGHESGRGLSSDPDDILAPASPDQIAAAVRAIPNNDLTWEGWNRLGMAIYAASDGEDWGFNIFDELSQRSTKYDATRTVARWEHYHRSPPNQLSAGTLFYEADQAEPGWRRKADQINEPQAEGSESRSNQYRLALPLHRHGEPVEPPRWLVRNRVPETGAGLLSGQWGMFKTFLFLDLSAHVIMGWDWTGEPIYRQAGVLLFAPEGASGISMRLAALVERCIMPKLNDPEFVGSTLPQKKMSAECLPFYWTNTIPTLLAPRRNNPLSILLDTAQEAHDRFMAEFGLPLGLIGIDTMATAAGWT